MRFRRCAPAAALRLQLIVAPVAAFRGCTDVLEGCCDRYSPDDCDVIPFNNMLEGLMCMTPTGEQCREMYVDCSCPISGGAPIDSWEHPCTPSNATEESWDRVRHRLETVPAVFMFDSATGQCTTCAAYLERHGFVAGDFPCMQRATAAPDGSRTGYSAEVEGSGESIYIDCFDELGARSGLPCPNSDPLPTVDTVAAPEFQPDTGLDCGEHGELVTIHGYETCHCPLEDGVECWQTNRERSNRWPNGNIKVYCSVSMCELDASGALVQVGLSGGQYEESGLGIVDLIAQSLGVSTMMVYAAFVLFMLLCACMVYSHTCGKKHVENDRYAEQNQPLAHGSVGDGQTQVNMGAMQNPLKSGQQLRWESKTGKTVDKEVWQAKKDERRRAKLKYCAVHGPKAWDNLEPDERRGVIASYRQQSLDEEGGLQMTLECVQGSLTPPMTM